MKPLSYILAILITLIMGVVVLYLALGVGINRISFAFWINWLLMFWAYALHRTGAVNFPEAYFRVRPFERRLYRLLGVGYFQRILRHVSVFNREIRLRGGKKDLVRLEKAMRGAEQAHAMIFAIVSGLTLYALFRGWWATAFWYFLFNMLLNGYPVMVQRFNRDRINGLLGR